MAYLAHQTAKESEMNAQQEATVSLDEFRQVAEKLSSFSAAGTANLNELREAVEKLSSLLEPRQEGLNLDELRKAAKRLSTTLKQGENGFGMWHGLVGMELRNVCRLTSQALGK